MKITLFHSLKILFEPNNKTSQICNATAKHKACYYYVKISRVVTDTPKRKCPAQLILILRHDLLLNVQCPFQCLLLHSRKAFILFIYIFSIYLFIEINIFRLASMLTPQYITQRMVFPGFSLTQCVD